ncbi:hypothetical protein OG616_36300 [Streptomyces antibioticus]|uniref:hypothetical protein n=1 Tax=Streptomyces antibioticus TaxID=1890 RepID=UPI00224F5C22|nr:hypothetical protein [Streptomyces antibioticus]MCX5173467.1 hypothetical protein [Streptomyces antibioticus]
MNHLGEVGKTRHLVLHDYGMGGLWWWVWAESAEEIVLACAEVEVVTTPETVERAETWALEEVHLDAPDPNPVSGLRAQREAQRGQPGFGVLAGRDRVYLRCQEDGDEAVYLMEFGPDGRRLRQVEVGPDGGAVKTTEEDWPFNPPFDLYDPQYASLEIDSTDFEVAWHRARPESQG